ncbi:hypothetical protein INS49_001815 [Diaporthe citri]|uniref:uncharacterized protein n=1 Tax=Diaporthe citri TaxID=83186 RepID=UPI001C7E303E|nr:uncharacterized protein INS49_001815 [Diaporthe citri]KAG6367622.1 hypothetical protein INS49_001815 [Diaporthe citri]
MARTRTPSTLKPFVPIQPKSISPEDPELLAKLQEVDKTIEDAKKKKEVLSAIASELKDANHHEAQQAAEDVEQAGKILADLIALRYNVLGE